MHNRIKSENYNKKHINIDMNYVTVASFTDKLMK